MAALVSEYTLEFFTLLNARGKKELIEWCMKEGLIASSYECPKCNEQMGLNERKSCFLDGFEWRCRKKDQPGLTHVLYLEIDTEDQGPYQQDRVKQGIIDYHIEKMLQEGIIRPIQSPYASPVVLTRKNNGLPPDSPEAYRFAIDYRKLNVITKYPRYPLPVIDDLITNIPHAGIMSTLDLKLCYFQLAISPKDIEKTAFVTRNGTFAFLRMPFGLSGAAPNFQISTLY
ncbi:retrovirus-related Pol polyprotein from transposon opus [Trichonephila clavipes]|uniref:Retrovirus-related Pol polyprotein from transposon opus n=1 Tax=Trichonephila clavipes TaxID=2585209 RepID=A0A8X6S6V2_TRICX|nr:retrovirus-related Pol polyprotein from transposon opus [Trichonephila clavipes]